ncbi:hypothetical protein [Streptomyces sp. NPDC047973]|uniref:hypothetical protein n=1 Tax=Streptomyces sp. NPDC047973 TaxID=3155383 RepID=UPI0034287465
MNDLIEEPVEDSGLGRVDLPFELLAELEFDTPALLHPFLESLHGNLEERPLAEQVIDAILAEDSSRYSTFDSVRVRAREAKIAGGAELQAQINELVGRFLIEWTKLEGLVRSLVPSDDMDPSRLTMLRLLERVPDLSESIRGEINSLRRIRNQLVHGGPIPDTAFLLGALDRLESVAARLRDNGGPAESANLV